jgi:Ni/Co efflux regulator RcnB
MRRAIVALAAAAVLATPAISSADQPSQQNKQNAAKDCRAEKNQDPAAFKEKYGTNENKSNAFGKCVSRKEHQQASGGGGGTP